MDAAASMIEKAIMANPTYAEAYNNLGLSLSLSLSLTHIFVHMPPCEKKKGYTVNSDEFVSGMFVNF